MLIASVASALIAMPAFAAENAVPDFSGFWLRNSIGFLPPASGPGPVMSVTHNVFTVVGDHTNPILKPEAADRVKKNGEIERSGRNFPTPSNACWPAPTPGFWSSLAVQVLQRQDEIAFFNIGYRRMRFIRMNQPHLAQIKPSWLGDSVGHFEGDTLVVDTVGIKVGPVSMVDVFGTPHSDALHVVERIRLIDAETARSAAGREEQSSGFIGPAEGGPPGFPANFRGKGLEIQFTVTDPAVFTTSWSGSVAFRQFAAQIPGGFEDICAENAHNYITGNDAPIPRADKPDF
jgi:hypothetical protein